MSTDLSFDDWIASGTTAQRTVTLYNDRAIPDQLDVLERQRKVAAAVAESGEASLGERSALAQIDAQMDALYERWQASQETWVVRALSSDEIKAIQAAHPAPKMPKQPKAPGKSAASAAITEAHEQDMQAWAVEASAVRDAADLDYLSRAVVRIETSAGTFPGVTVDQLDALRSRPGRQGDIARLLEAAVDASKGDQEPPVPFSRRGSATDPD